MGNIPYISALRPDATRICTYLTNASSPKKAKEIVEALELPYSSVMYHMEYLMNKAQVERFNLKGQRGYFFGIVGREYENVEKSNVIELRVSKPKIKKDAPKVALSPQVWWPYAEKYLTVPEILIFEREQEETAGKDYGRGIMARRLITAMTSMVETLSVEDMTTLREELTRQHRVVLGHMRAYDDLLSAMDKHKTPEELHRALVTENVSVTPDDMLALHMRKQHLWGNAQISNMTETNYAMRNWILGLFHASWNNPFTVEEIMRVFPAMQKERVELVLSSEKNGDMDLFREKKAGRINKWNCAFPDYDTGISLKVSGMIHEKKILEHMFELVSRGPAQA